MKKIIVFFISLFMMLNSSMAIMAEDGSEADNSEIIQQSVDTSSDGNNTETYTGPTYADTPLFTAYFDTSTGDLVISSEDKTWINKITSVRLVATNSTVSTISANAHKENGDMYLIKNSDPNSKDLTYIMSGRPRPNFSGDDLYDADVYAILMENITSNAVNKYITSGRADFVNNPDAYNSLYIDGNGNARISRDTLKGSVTSGVYIVYVFSDGYKMGALPGVEIDYIAPRPLNVVSGETIQFAVGTKEKVNWSVSDGNLASITENGFVTFKNAGTVTVYATTGGYTDSYTVEVGSKVVYVFPSQDAEGNIYIRATDQNFLKAVVEPRQSADGITVSDGGYAVLNHIYIGNYNGTNNGYQSNQISMKYVEKDDGDAYIFIPKEVILDIGIEPINNSPIDFDTSNGVSYNVYHDTLNITVGCKEVPTDITVFENENGDIVFKSADKDYLKALCTIRESIQLEGYQVYGSYLNVKGNGYNFSINNYDSRNINLVYSEDDAYGYAAWTNKSQLDRGFVNGTYECTIDAYGYKSSTDTKYSFTITHGAKDVGEISITESDTEVIIKASGTDANTWYTNLVDGIRDNYITDDDSNKGNINITAEINGTSYWGNISNFVGISSENTSEYIFIELVNNELHISKEKLKEVGYVDGKYRFQFNVEGFKASVVSDVELHFGKTLTPNRVSTLILNNVPSPVVGQDAIVNMNEIVLTAIYPDGSQRQLSNDDFTAYWAVKTTDPNGEEWYSGIYNDTIREGKQYYLVISYHYQYTGNDLNNPLTLSFRGSSYTGDNRVMGVSPVSGLHIHDNQRFYIPVETQSANIYDVYLNADRQSVKLEGHKMGQNSIVWETVGNPMELQELNRYFANNYRSCTVTYKTPDGVEHTSEAKFKSMNAFGRHAYMIVIEEGNTTNYIAPFTMGSSINDANITKIETDINGKTYEFSKKSEYRVHNTDVYLLDESVDRNSLPEFIDIRIFHENGNIESRRIYTRNHFMSIGMGLNYKGERYYFDANDSSDNMVIIAYDVILEDITEVALFVNGTNVPLEKQVNKYDFNNLGVQIVYNVNGRDFNESDWQNYNTAIMSDNYYFTYKKDGEPYTLDAPFGERPSVNHFGLLEKVVTDNATYTFIAQNRGGALISDQIEKAYIYVDNKEYVLGYSESESTTDTKIYVLNEEIDSEKLNSVNNVNIVFKGTGGQVFGYGSLNNSYNIGNKVYTGTSVDYYGEDGRFTTYIFAVRVAVSPVSNAKIHIGDVTVDLTLNTWWENDRQNRVWRFDYENDGEDAGRAHDLFRNENVEFYLTYENAEGNEIRVDQDKFSMQNNYNNHGWMYNLSVDDFDYTFIAFGDGFAISSPSFNKAWVVTESGRVDFAKSDVYSTEEYDVYMLESDVNVDDIGDYYIETEDGSVTRFGGRSRYEIDGTIYTGEKVYYTENGNPDKFFILATGVFKNNISNVKFYAGDELVRDAESQIIYTKDGYYYEWFLRGEDNYRWHDYFYNENEIERTAKVTYFDSNNVSHTVEIPTEPTIIRDVHGIGKEVEIDGVKHVFIITSDGLAFDSKQIASINVKYSDNVYSIEPYKRYEEQDIDVYMINGDKSAENFLDEARIEFRMQDGSFHSMWLDQVLSFDNNYYKGFGFYDKSGTGRVFYAIEDHSNRFSDMVIHANGLEGELSAFMNGGYDEDVVYLWDFEQYSEVVRDIYKYILDENGTDYYVTYKDETGKEHRIDGPFEEGNYLWCHGFGKELDDNGAKHIILAGYIGQCIEDTGFNRAYVEVDGIEYEFNISDKLSTDGRVVYLLDEKCDVSKLADDVNVILEYDSYKMNIYGKDYYVVSDELQFTGGHGYFTANGNENNVMIFATKVLRNTISDVKLHFGDYVENLVLNTDSHYHYMIEGDGLSFIWTVQWDGATSIADFEDSKSYYLTYKDSNGEEHRINGPFPSSNNYDMHSFSYVADIDGYRHCFALDVGPAFDRDSFVDAYTTVDGKDYSYIYSEELSYEGREVYVLDENCDLSLAGRMRAVVVNHKDYSYEIDTGVRYVYDDCIFTGARMFYSNEKGNDNVVIFADKVIRLPKIIAKPSTKTGLVYSGRPQTLVKAGKIENGELRYALSSAADVVPADDEFSTDVPVGVNAGTYYVYYGVYSEETELVKQYLGTAVIAKGNPKPSIPTTLKAVYGSTLESVTLDSSFRWVNPKQSVGNATLDGRTFAAVYTPDDTDNYKEIFVDINVIVLKANNTAPTYTGVLKAEKDTLLKNIKLDTGWTWMYPDNKVGDVNLAKYVNNDPENLNDVIVSLPVSIIHQVKVEDNEKPKEVSVVVKVEENKGDTTTQATDVKVSNDTITNAIIDVASNKQTTAVVDQKVAEAIKKNDSVEVSTSFVKEEKEEVKAEDKEKFDEFIDSEQKTAEMILDLSIDVTVKSGEEVTTGKMTELPEPITVTIDLPATAKVEAEPGTAVVYFVLIMHDGSVEKIEATLDEATRTVSFDTDKFSTYMLVSEVVKTSTPGDLNSDGDINGIDRILLRKYITEKITADSIDIIAADLNGDGEVDALDRTYLRNLATGKINS